MRFRGSGVCAVVATGALLALSVLAFADPADPSWVGGFWDDGDYDDVVTLITSTVGVVESSPCLSRGPIRIIVALVAYLRERPDFVPERKSHRPRDPPGA